MLSADLQSCSVHLVQFQLQADLLELMASGRGYGITLDITPVPAIDSHILSSRVPARNTLMASVVRQTP